MIRARRLNSSLIDRIMHDDETNTLTVWFRASGKYLYHAVPRALYDALKTAESAGRLFNDRIRGRYPCEPDPARRRHRPEHAVEYTADPTVRPEPGSDPSK